MTGADIVAALVRADPDIAKIATPDRIKLGRLPDGVALTAFLIRTISVIERQPLKRTGFVKRTDRVSVTVRAASYRDQVAAIGAVRRACFGLTGTVGGGTGVSILSAGTGPDVAGPANSFEQAQDFRVSFDEPA